MEYLQTVNIPHKISFRHAIGSHRSLENKNGELRMKRILFALMMVGIVGGLQACAMKQGDCGCADGQCKTMKHGKKAKKDKATAPAATPAKK